MNMMSSKKKTLIAAKSILEVEWMTQMEEHQVLEEITSLKPNEDPRTITQAVTSFVDAKSDIYLTQLCIRISSRNTMELLQQELILLSSLQDVEEADLERLSAKLTRIMSELRLERVTMPKDRKVTCLTQAIWQVPDLQNTKWCRWLKRYKKSCSSSRTLKALEVLQTLWNGFAMCLIYNLV